MKGSDAAKEYVNKHVAQNDGTYWGWNSDDMAIAENAYLAGYKAGCLRALKEVLALPKVTIRRGFISPVETIQVDRINRLKEEAK